MMAAENSIQVTEADIASTAEKLAQFGQALPEAEQAVLRQLIVRAAQGGQAGDEVQGYFTLIETPGLLQAQSLLPYVRAAVSLGDGSVRLTPGALQGVPAVQKQQR
jgi:hypothetical protein